MGSPWGDVPTWIGLIGAFVAFRAGLNQYRTAQQWKRAEFVAAEMKAFFADSQIAIALILVDYSPIRLDHEGRLSKAGWVFDDDKLISSLAIHTQFADDIERFEDDEMLARLAFDSLLTGLERFDHYLRTRLIDLEDLKVYLDYWIDKMGNPSKEWKKPEFYDAFAAFVRAYGYRGVEHLFVEFGVPLPVRKGAPTSSGLR
jgi:hypothetical protein